MEEWPEVKLEPVGTLILSHPGGSRLGRWCNICGAVVADHPEAINRHKAWHKSIFGLLHDLEELALAAD